MGIFAYLKMLLTPYPKSVDSIISSLVDMADSLEEHRISKVNEGATLFDRARECREEAEKADKVYTALLGIIG